jgi:hypothetical protein
VRGKLDHVDHLGETREFCTRFEEEHIERLEGLGLLHAISSSCDSAVPE